MSLKVSVVCIDGSGKSTLPRTLPMALSDTERYYQAGTVPSALVGLNKTVSNAEHNADTAKDQVSPNAPQVSNSKSTAVPVAANAATTIVRNPTVPGSAVRVTSTIASDDAAVALRRFWKPSGVVDPRNEKIITDFMAQKGITESIAFFIRSAQYAAQRDELARQRGLIR